MRKKKLVIRFGKWRPSMIFIYFILKGLFYIFCIRKSPAQTDLASCQ